MTDDGTIFDAEDILVLTDVANALTATGQGYPNLLFQLGLIAGGISRYLEAHGRESLPTKEVARRRSTDH